MAFQKGNPGGPGRPPGSRNKLSERFIDALYRDFSEHGVAAIAAARAESPLGYLRVVAGLVPHKLEVASTGGGVSDEDLVAIIRDAARRGDGGQSDPDEIEMPVH